jgi:hypothetical protein
MVIVVNILEVSRVSGLDPGLESGQPGLYWSQQAYEGVMRGPRRQRSRHEPEQGQLSCVLKDDLNPLVWSVDVLMCRTT